VTFAPGQFNGAVIENDVNGKAMAYSSGDCGYNYVSLSFLSLHEVAFQLAMPIPAEWLEYERFPSNGPYAELWHPLMGSITLAASIPGSETQTIVLIVFNDDGLYEAETLIINTREFRGRAPQNHPPATSSYHMDVVAEIGVDPADPTTSQGSEGAPDATEPEPVGRVAFPPETTRRFCYCKATTGNQLLAPCKSRNRCARTVSTGGAAGNQDPLQKSRKTEGRGRISPGHWP